MAAPAPRLLLAALLLVPMAVGAQPAPPARQAPAPASPARPAVQPAPRTPVQREAPIVRPRPGTAGERPPAPRTPARPPAHAPARPSAHPGARPPARAPAAVPVPVPSPAPEAERPVEPGKGSNSGLPLPRFATLRSDEVNLRTGPGTRYPIDWVYKRRDLPVQIEREFEVWRLIRDQEGVKGWVHAATLAPRRTAVVVNDEHALRSAAQDDASPVARLKPGVIVRIRSCDAASDWCQAQVGDYRGWLRRTEMWGLLPGEVVQ